MIKGKLRLKCLKCGKKFTRAIGKDEAILFRCPRCNELTITITKGGAK